MNEAVHFIVVSVLGKKIEVTDAYWRYIVSVKHPSIFGYEAEVRQALVTPDLVKTSQLLDK